MDLLGIYALLASGSRLSQWRIQDVEKRFFDVAGPRRRNTVRACILCGSLRESHPSAG